ncbi:hypothetical protein D9M73_269590 [compost metagenome]
MRSDAVCRGEFIRQAGGRSTASSIPLTLTLSRGERELVRCSPELPVGANSFAKQAAGLPTEDRP